MLAFVVAGVLLSGCGSGGSSSTSTSTEESSASTEASTAGGVEGTVHVLITAEIQKAMETVGEEFEEANPNANVEFEIVSIENLVPVELTRMRSGSAPDLMVATAGSSEKGSVLDDAKLGLLEDLSEQHWTTEMAKVISRSVEYEGKPYAFPTYMAPFTAIYNKGALSELGATLPQTYGELIDLCHEASENGVTAIALGAQEGWTSLFPASALAAVTVEPDFAEKQTAEEATFAESKGWLKSLEMFEEMDEEECFGPSPTGYGITGADQDVASGKALMLVGVPTFAVSIGEANPKAELAQFPLPTAPNAEDLRVPFIASYPMVVPKSAQNPEFGKDFLSFLAERDQQYAEESSSLPAVGFTSLEEVALPKDMSAFKPYMNDEHAVPWEPALWPNPEVQSQWESGMQGMLSGTGTTPEQILESMDKAWSEGS